MIQKSSTACIGVRCHRCPNLPDVRSDEHRTEPATEAGRILLYDAISGKGRAMPTLTRNAIKVESYRAQWVKRLARAVTTKDRDDALETIAFCDEILATLAVDSPAQAGDSSKSGG